MDTIIDQQVASDISSKESTLQLVYDVLRLTPFFKAFLVIADVPKIYMQEFWATTMVHHHSIRFKMDNKKHIVHLESFMEMLHICPRLPGQTFVEPPFEEEIMAFLRFLGHSRAIRRLTDVNINKLHQPWRSFAAIINKCLTRKSLGYDSLRWNIKMQRRAMRCIILGSQRDDHMFTTIKLVSRHQNTQQFGAMFPIELTNADIRKSDAYKEYDAVATRATPPKTKASVRKTKSSFDTTVNHPPTVDAGPRLSTFAKGKQPAKASKAKSDDDDDDDDEDDQEEGSDDEQASDKEDEEFIHPSLSTHDEEETRDEESFNPIPKTPENTDDEGNGEENLRTNVGREEGHDEEAEEDELYRDVNINLGRGVQMADVQTIQEFEDSHVILTSVNPDGQQQSSFVSSQFVTSMLNPTPMQELSLFLRQPPRWMYRLQPQWPPLPVSAPTLTPSTFATVTTIQQFAGAVSSIPRIIQRYMDQRMNKAVKVVVQIQSDRLRDEAQAENDEFLKTIDENMQKIIKEQVKEQVKVQVSKILPKIEQSVNEQLEAKVLTRPSNSSKTSYVVAADLSKMELNKILIEKMEGNKSIHRSNEQRNLYKALVEAYKSDKIILDTYGDTVTLKRRRDDDADKDKEPSARSDRGSKRRRKGKEPESASAPKEKATRSAGNLTQGSKSRQTSASESTTAEEPMQTTYEMEEPLHPEFETGADDQPIIEHSQHPEWFSQQKKPPTPNRDWNKTLPATHRSIQPWISNLAKQYDSRSSFNELMDTPVDFSAFLMNRLKVDTLTPELLVGPTYELMKGSCKSLVELEFILEEVYRLGASSRKYTTSVTKTKAADYGHIKWIEDLVPRTMWIQKPESARDVYSKRRIIAVTELKIVEWHNYKHLDWITVRKDDDKLYKFKEGDLKRLHIQDIEDMLLLLVQGKLTNLTVEECFAFNVSLRMFIRSIVIQRRVEDLQLGIESYQKKLNLTRSDTYRSDLKRKESYITYSNPKGFIYQNKDK
nr:hypothetical protein [Tanacetum cinerariifolium]